MRTLLTRAATSARRHGVAALIPLVILGLVVVVVTYRQPAAPSSVSMQVVPLTFDGPGAANEFPQASPDGRFIVFQRSEKPTISTSLSGKTIYTFKEDSDWDVYRMRIDGSERVRLTDSPKVEDEPTYSPDGSMIAYRVVRNGSSDLFLMDPDGGNKRPLVADPNTEEKTPAFSPDGRRVIFYGNRAATADWNLFTVDVASRKVQQLTSGLHQDKHPQITPDGGEVIFHSDRRGIQVPLGARGKRTDTMTLFSLSLGSGQMRPLLVDDDENLQDSRHSFVSRDGRFIVYHAQTFGKDRQHPGTYRRLREDIYLMTRDGRRRINLTEHDPRLFKHPSWSADGRGIFCVFDDKAHVNVWNVGYIDVTSALQQLN